jgi:hypothetical protein
MGFEDVTVELAFKKCCVEEEGRWSKPDIHVLLDMIHSFKLVETPGPTTTTTITRTRTNMKREADRLESYNGVWSKDFPVDPAALAKVGFYFMGPNDRVQCAFCHDVIEGWQRGDCPLVRHKRLNAECSMVLTQTLRQRLAALCTEEAQILKDTGFANSLIEAAFEQIQREDDSLESNANPEVSLLERLFRTLHDLTSRENKETQVPDMTKEADRLVTYEINWYDDLPVTAAALAKAGFYYIGPHDRVQCAFCKEKMYNWVQDDIPIDEHRRHFPDCPFVQLMENENPPPVNNDDKKARLEKSGVDCSGKNTQGVVAAAECSATTISSSSTTTLPKSVKLENNDEITTEEGYLKIKRENELLKSALICNICMIEKVMYTFLPCGHLCTCLSCGEQVSHCPLCRTKILGRVKTFSS